jgi:hypothetical protein
VYRCSFLGLKVDHSPRSLAEVKNELSSTYMRSRSAQGTLEGTAAHLLGLECTSLYRVRYLELNKHGILKECEITKNEEDEVKRI